MVDNYHQHHLFIIVTEVEHLINTTDTRLTKITGRAVIVDIPANHIATTDHTVIIDLTVTMDLKTDTITEIIIVADHKAITEIIIIIIQTPEIVATALIEITVVIAHIIIKIKTTSCHEVILDHRINRDHLLKKIMEIHTIITEVDTIVMIETETQLVEITVMDEITTTIIAASQNPINDKVEME